MKPIKREDLPRVPGEEIIMCTYLDHDTDTLYGLKMEEPRNQEEYHKFGPWIASVELETKNKPYKMIRDSEEIWKVNDLPIAIQGFIHVCRQEIRQKQGHNDVAGSLENILKAKGMDVRISEITSMEDIIGLLKKLNPAKYGGSPERKYPDCKGWILIDMNSGMELPWGEIVRLPDGDEFELIGGTPPLQEGIGTGKIVVMSEDQTESEHFPSMFDLKWALNLKAKHHAS